MGGYFGAVSHRDTVLDIFFGTDYHSHLGTRNAGMAVWNAASGDRRVTLDINMAWSVKRNRRTSRERRQCRTAKDNRLGCEVPRHLFSG